MKIKQCGSLTCIDHSVHVGHYREPDGTSVPRSVQSTRPCNGSCEKWGDHTQKGNLASLFSATEAIHGQVGVSVIEVDGGIETITSAAVQYTHRTKKPARCLAGSPIAVSDGDGDYVKLLQSPIHDRIREQPWGPLQSEPLMDPKTIEEIVQTRPYDSWIKNDLRQPWWSKERSEEYRLVGYGPRLGGLGYNIHVFEWLDPNKCSHLKGVHGLRWWVKPVAVTYDEISNIRRLAPWFQSRGVLFANEVRERFGEFALIELASDKGWHFSISSPKDDDGLMMRDVPQGW